MSDSPIVDYTHMSKDNLARLLVSHQRVIERIMNLKYTIIPLRLGTFAINEAGVKDILNKGYNLIKEILEKIHDKIEIEVCATWKDFASRVKEAGEERQIKEFSEKLLANPTGITVEDQMKVGIMVKKALDTERERYAKEIEDALRTVSQDIKVHELMDDKMIINTAFLIDRTRQKEFEKRVEELNAKFNERLNFRCVGPLPLYSFYTLTIKKMQFEEIDWARKRLGLSDSAGKDEIRRAYQRAAASTHPDINPEIERGFDDVNRAYKMLVDYGRACEQTGEKEGYSFREEELKRNAILVKLL